tara:strand:+ start:2502 stop:2822 length:321 start_codon:yes stop_codon:yes gene_type:complete
MSDEKIIIDLRNKQPLNERLFTQLGAKIRGIMLDLYHMGFDVPLTIKGTQSQIDSFFKALKGEKRYMDSYIKHGLGDDRTLSDRHRLMGAIEKFERETGLRWPFKN